MRQKLILLRKHFYDTVITRFFSKEKMMKIVEKDALHLAIAGKLDGTRHILNGADYFLDIIPTDSIFVRHFDSDRIPNTLEIYFIANTKEVPVLLCHFDPSTNLLVGLSGGATPGTEEFMS